MSTPSLPNNSKFNSKVADITIEIEKTKDVMRDNIENTLKRGDDLERLVEKTDEMQQNASTFSKKATSLKRHMCWQNYKFAFIIALIVIAVLIVLGLIIYGATKK